MSDLKIFSSITDFWHDVRDMCESAPGLNQMLGGITYRLMRDNAAADAFAQQPNVMLVQKLDGKVTGAALYGNISTGVGSASFLCVLGGVSSGAACLSPDACEALALHVKAGEISAVIGDTRSCDVLVRALSTRDPTHTARLGLTTNSYQLDRAGLRAPPMGAGGEGAGAGKLRMVSPEDSDLLDLLGQWTNAFTADAMGPGLEITVDKARKVAQENAADGHLFVWEAPGLSEAGTWTPVAMAAIVRELSNAMSISKVYTPPEHRRRGYAQQVVAGICQHIFETHGKQYVLLFADSALEHTNALYSRLGFVQVGQQVDWRFTPADCRS